MNRKQRILEEIIIDGEIANIMLNVFKNNPKLRYKVYDMLVLMAWIYTRI